jgi:hypothetical protein
MRITAVVAATAVAGSLAAGSVGLAGSAGAAPTTHATTARTDWTKGAHVDAAVQSRYWSASRHQLATYGARYAHERGDLAALVSIPLTDTTAAQRATAARVTRELNGFFHTAGLYGVPAGNPKKIARADWIKSAHVSAARQNDWLGSAKDELDAYGKRYRNERADLSSLESIPLTSTTPKQQATAHRDRRALNRFFHTPGLGT